MNKVYDHWSHYPMRDWRWPNFSPQELACKGTGKLMIDPAAMDKLQALRTRLARPLILNSAYRSPEHNAAVKGAKSSYHMKAMAFDTRMDNHDPAEFQRAARAVGFTGIGTYPRFGFIHVDNRADIGAVPAAWGDPFPPSASGLAADQRQPPESIARNPTAQAAGTMGLAATGIGLADQVTRDGGIIERLQDPTTFVFVIGMVAAFIIYREWKGRA